MPVALTTAGVRLTTAGLRRAVTVCLLLLGMLLGSAPAAAAHAELLSSTPANGSVLAAEPHRVALVFSEAVTSGLSSIRVVGPDGRRIDSGSPRLARSDGTELAVALAADPQPGTYVLDWLATAADDGHATSGTLTFSVGAPSRTGPSVGFGRPDRVTDAVLDLVIWCGFGGLALLVGSAAIRLCRDRSATGPRWPATLGWAVLLAASLAQLFVHGPATQGLPLSHVGDRSLLAATLGTREGHALVARIVLLAVVAAVGEWMLRRAWGLVPAALLALALAGTWSVISHAADGPLVPLALAVTTLHVTAMAVWAGGLFGLAVLLTAGADPDLGDTAARFSRLALGAVAVLAATGLYQAFRELTGPGELTGTGYGRLLLVKTAVLLPVLAVAYLSRTRAARARERGTVPLRRSVLLELGGVAVLLAVTVLLIGTAPPRDTHQLPAAGSSSPNSSSAGWPGDAVAHVGGGADHRR